MSDEVRRQKKREGEKEDDALVVNRVGGGGGSDKRKKVRVDMRADIGAHQDNACYLLCYIFSPSYHHRRLAQGLM